MIRLAAGAIAFTVICLVACDSNTIFEQAYDLDPYQGWEYTEELEFPFSIEDTTATYRLFLDLEHGTEYSYQNLYLRLTTIFPNGESAQSPLSLELADKTGQWYGKCGSKTCNVSIPLQEEIHFNAIGEYTVGIEQYMRENPVMELHSLGLRLIRE